MEQVAKCERLSGCGLGASLAGIMGMALLVVAFVAGADPPSSFRHVLVGPSGTYSSGLVSPRAVSLVEGVAPTVKARGFKDAEARHTVAKALAAHHVATAVWLAKDISLHIYNDLVWGAAALLLALAGALALPLVRGDASFEELARKSIV
jgi:hypothetical protein